MKKLTTEEFINKAIKVHDNKYDYSKVNYKKNEEKIEITCFKHGKFWQRPHDHLSKRGCPLCNPSYSMNTNTFIEKAKKIHNTLFIYDKVIYTGSKNKIILICSICKHEFSQSPANHLSGHGCPKCQKNHKMNKEEFISKAIKKHENIYDYSLVVYINNQKKVSIICNKHGMFYQTPHKHLSGRNCPLCAESIPEEKIRNWLLKNNISSVSQKTFNACIGKNKGKLKFDFYIPHHNTCIEYDGIHHYIPTNFNGKKSQEELIKIFNIQKENDKIKNIYCEKNNILLLRIPYTDFDNIEKILSDYFKPELKNANYNHL